MLKGLKVREGRRTGDGMFGGARERVAWAKPFGFSQGKHREW